MTFYSINITFMYFTVDIFTVNLTLKSSEQVNIIKYYHYFFL